jgi:hypothetical protein
VQYLPVASVPTFRAFPAWPGSGLRLWAFPVPGNLAFTGPRPAVMLAYNAAGQVVWQQKYA